MGRALVSGARRCLTVAAGVFCPADGSASVLVLRELHELRGALPVEWVPVVDTEIARLDAELVRIARDRGISARAVRDLEVWLAGLSPSDYLLVAAYAS